MNRKAAEKSVVTRATRKAFLAAACIAAFGLVGTKTRAEPPRPLIVVFAGGQEKTGRAAQGAGSDALTASERSRQAAQAVRERLDDSRLFTTALYNPDTALFLRAMQEAKIRLNNSDAPSDKERRALGKAAGAVYVVWVGAAQAPASTTSGVTAPSGSVEIELRGTDIARGGDYSDRSLTQAGAVFFAPPPSDSNAVKSAGQNATPRSDALLSAANTLVVRLLAGPLREFSRVAPPPNLLPPLPPPASGPEPDAPPVSAADVRAQADMDAQDSRAALAQADGLLGAGDAGAAIVLLRKSVSLYPLNLYLRADLARAYGMKKRWDEAASEARRALTIVPLPKDSAGVEAKTKDTQTRGELTRLFSEALQRSGDANATRQAYEQVIAAQPGANGVWARIAYADVLLRQNKTEAAKTQLKVVQDVSGQNPDASVLLARIYAAEGEYQTALTALSGSGASPLARSRAAGTLFDEASVRLADVLSSNRTAWETGKITREGMYKATQAQATRAALLVDVLKSAPSPALAGSPENQAYQHRIRAAQVLGQSVGSLLTLLDSGDREAGIQSNLLLDTFRREAAAAQGL